MNEAQRPLRVMRIIARLNVGGPAIHVTLLTRQFSERGHDSCLICGAVGADEGDMIYYAEQHGVAPVILPELGRSIHPLRDIATTYKLYRMIRAFQPDIVHTHTAKAGFTGRVAAWLARVPVIVHTFHGHVFSGYFSPAKTRLFLWLERITARMSDTIITLTDGLKRELADEYRVAPAAQFTVLPLGLDLAPFAQTGRHAGDFRAAHGIPPDVPLVGIVGRLVPVKNHALFFAAAAQIHAQRPDVHFAIIGDGETRAELEAQVAALGLRDVTTFTGWQQHLPPIYSDLDVSVISSKNEGTPVSVIESLAAGCPVVATAVGGLPDLLDAGALGRLVPPGDADALAAAILETLAHPPQADTAQALMLERYGIARLVDDLESLYRDLLRRKGR